MRKLFLLFVGVALFTSCMPPVEQADKNNTPIAITEAKCDTVLMVITPDIKDNQDIYILTKDKEPMYQIDNAFDNSSFFVWFFIGFVLVALVCLLIAVLTIEYGI